VVRIDLHWSQDHTANIQVRDFFRYSGALSGADAVTWQAAIVSAAQTMTSANLSTAVTLYKVELTDLTTVTSPQEITATSTAGTDGNPANPASTAFVVSKRIARRFRGGHARIYIPGTTNSHLTNSTQWSGAGITLYFGAYSTFVAAVIAGAPGGLGTVDHVAVSYYHGFTVSAPPGKRAKNIPTLRVTPLVDAVVNLASNATPGNQRRREETP
jgi:hypothetical protein